jgi:glycine cleavage system H protein
MSDVKDLKFSKEHEWVKVDGNIGTVGISDYAQHELGDVVYVELPEVDSEVSEGDACANIESVKAVSDIYAPVSGKVTETNETLEDEPELINNDPYGNGWIFKMEMSDSSQLDNLMDYAAYEEYLKGLSE